MIRLCAFSDEADASLSGQIRALRRNGIDLTELRSINGVNISKLGEHDAVKIKNELDAAGIRVWSLGSPYGKISLRDHCDKDAIFAQLRRLCELAGIFATDKIRIFSFYDSYDKRDLVIELLDESVRIAGSYGVKLYHENEKDIYGDVPERVLDLYENVPGLRLVYDPANYIQCGVSPDDSFRLIPEAGYFHIKDAVADTGELVPSGRGDGRIVELIGLIYKETVMTVEPHLAVFSGYSDIDRREMKNRYSYKTSGEAFDTAVSSLKTLLIKNGYENGGNNTWTRD